MALCHDLCYNKHMVERDRNQDHISPEQVSVRAMVASDVGKIQSNLDSEFSAGDVMKPFHIAFIAEAGDTIVGYMIYKLDKGKAVVQKCLTHPEFRHAAYDMIIGLMTGGVMEEVHRKWKFLFDADPSDLHPTTEVGEEIQEVLKLRQKLKQLVPAAFTGIRRRDHISMDVERGDSFRHILGELGFDIVEEESDEEKVHMEYHAMSE